MNIEVINLSLFKSILNWSEYVTNTLFSLRCHVLNKMTNYRLVIVRDLFQLKIIYYWGTYNEYGHGHAYA